MARVTLGSREMQAIREGSSGLQSVQKAIWRATPEQIEARIDGASMEDLRKLLTVLTIVCRNQEQRLRELERSR